MKNRAVCMLCEAMCGLLVELDGDEVRSVRGDREDPFSRGHICPKALAIADIMRDPDRVRAPLRRIGSPDEGQWATVPWDEALEEVTQRLAGIQKVHGHDAVASYFGNPVGHSAGAMLAQMWIQKTLASRNRFSASSSDIHPHTLASFLMFGHVMLTPIPDIERCQLLVCIGGNPAISNGSLMSAPDMRRRLEALRRRGGQLIVIDPRCSETAKRADLHLQVRPGGDAALLLGILHVLFAEGLTDLGRLKSFTEGVDRLEELAARFPPERVAKRAGVSAAAILDLAHRIARSERAAIYGRFGASTQMFGGLACWLINVLNAVTGNLDEVGGAMFTHPAVDIVKLMSDGGQAGQYDTWRSRVRGLPEFCEELPTAVLAEEILTPGAGQVKALLTLAGNPVLSAPNGKELERALGELSFMVSFDLYRNETTRFADFILPPSFGFERDHYDLVFNAWAVRNVARFTPALVAPPAGVREEFELLMDFARRLKWKRDGWRGLGFATLMRLVRWIGLRRTLAALLRFGPHGAGILGGGLTLTRLMQMPTGADLGPLSRALPDRLHTADRRIQLAPEQYLSDLPRLEAELGVHEAGLVLIGRRLTRSNNSWMHNARRLVKGKSECVLLIHPDDARTRGLVDGSQVQVRSRVGEVRVPVKVSEDMRRGVVSLPHGFGHTRAGCAQSEAQAHPGASVNDLTDELRVDPLSGVAAFSGVPVDVSLVSSAADRDP